MKYVISWTGREASGEAQSHRLLDVFSKWTPSAGVTFHQFLARLDGNGGFAVIETDDPTAVLKDVAKFLPWLNYAVYPVVEIQEVTAAFGEAFAFWDSVG